MCWSKSALRIEVLRARPKCVYAYVYVYRCILCVCASCMCVHVCGHFKYERYFLHMPPIKRWVCVLRPLDLGGAVTL